MVSHRSAVLLLLLATVLGVLVCPCPAWAAEPAQAGLGGVPDFPAGLRREQPVKDIGDAVVFTVNEPIRGERDLEMLRKVGADVAIRGWFKWHQAFDVRPLPEMVRRAHGMGALFGGGVTCSALYHGENGLADADVLDMATRAADGSLVDAWNTKGCRHGTLSNPRYVDYVFRWCAQQIDAGVDYLFMDEINAALQRNEGFDDYSNRDFRRHLMEKFSEKQGWAKDDVRWRTQFKVDLADKAVCPDGTIGSFEYRAYLKAVGCTAEPHHVAKNPLAVEWLAFRRLRDDRAWKGLTERIRAYGAQKGRRVYISGNGLAPYVDLQVLGVWGHWKVTDGRIDLAESQAAEWAAIVRAGRALAQSAVGSGQSAVAVAGKTPVAQARRRVPVVLFHDWGFEGFPYQKVAPAQRALWDRVRGAEVYAAGAFYAFPVNGPFGCDAGRDGLLAGIGRQAAFYQRHRDLYLKAEMRGVDVVTPLGPLLSATLWSRAASPALIVHVINRKAEGPAESPRLVKRKNVVVRLPVAVAPKAVRVVSPDWEGERAGETQRDGDSLRVVIPELEAYAVAVLEYDAMPAFRAVGDRIMLERRWERPEVAEFKVTRDGVIERPNELNGVLQGRLHAGLANPPTFLVNATGPARMSFKLGAVATQGARPECLLDDQLVWGADLGDVDGKNDTGAAELGMETTVGIPAGRHRITLRNIGPDWVTITWVRFEGELGE